MEGKSLWQNLRCAGADRGFTPKARKFVRRSYPSEWQASAAALAFAQPVTRAGLSLAAGPGGALPERPRRGDNLAVLAEGGQFRRRANHRIAASGSFRFDAARRDAGAEAIDHAGRKTRSE
jgi:hypothetical protein